MSLEITEELIARQTPEARAIIRLWLAKLTRGVARSNRWPRTHSLTTPRGANGYVRQ